MATQLEEVDLMEEGMVLEVVMADMEADGVVVSDGDRMADSCVRQAGCKQSKRTRNVGDLAGRQFTSGRS